MTVVTISPGEISAYNHAGKTGCCIAVSSIVQCAGRILKAGKSLETINVDTNAPSFGLVARRNRLTEAVIDGVFESLTEIAAMNPALLSVVDKR